MDFAPVRFGKYLLLERINIGGMAEVFRAKTFGVEGFERIVAIKRILPSLVEDEEFVTMFIDEARIAVQLNHPNIAQIYELGKHGDHYYIAMEFLASRDLRLVLDRLNEHEQLMPVPQAAYIATKICEALDYAHRKRDPGGTPMNIIHRDVSPQNILISFDGEVKMIDFGIAKAANRASKTQVGVLKGKFAYMSPEQVRGLPIDRRSDVFAVGIVLYEMLTGERLFIAESDFSTLQKVRDAVVEPPSSFNGKITSELETIVMRALAREVDDRFQWASELAEELQPFLIEGRSIYGPKNLESFLGDSYASEVAIERDKMEQFREVGLSGLQFEEAEEETEPASPETSKETQEQEVEMDSDEDGETIILEVSNALQALNASDGPAGKKKAKPILTQATSIGIHSETAESDNDDDDGYEEDEDSDVTIVQMAQHETEQQSAASGNDVEAEIDSGDIANIPEDLAITDNSFRPGLTHPSQESELPTIAMPIEEIRKAGDSFHSDEQMEELDTEDRPSLTLPADLSDEEYLGSRDATLSGKNAPIKEIPGQDFSYTADTVGLDSDVASPIRIDKTKGLLGVKLKEKTAVAPVVPTDAITASQSIPPEGSLGIDQSSMSHGASFSEFYGSPISNNPFIATFASWIRLIPKAFRMPVFVMLGAVFALFFVLMIVGVMRIFEAPVGQIELQKMPDAQLPKELKIYLDEVLVGTTLPLKIPNVKPGPHQLKANAGPECEAPEFEVKVLEGQAIFLPLPIECGLNKETPKAKPEKFIEWQVEIRVIDVNRRPIENAVVFIDGANKGSAPLTTSIPRKKDSVKILIKASGFENKRLMASHNGVPMPPPIVVEMKRAKERLNLSSSKPKRSATKKPSRKPPKPVAKPEKKPQTDNSTSNRYQGFKKTKKMTQLEIATSPSAKVFLDGKDTGFATPIYNARALKLSVGTHVLEFRVKGIRSGYKYRVNVKGVSDENKIVIQKLGKNKLRTYGEIEARLLR